MFIFVNSILVFKKNENLLKSPKGDTGVLNLVNIQEHMVCMFLYVFYFHKKKEKIADISILVVR